MERKIYDRKRVHDKKIHQWVKHHLGNEPTGHDYWHAYRVWQLAKTIATKEGGDPLIIDIAALVHEIIDKKTFGEEQGKHMLLNLFQDLRIEEYTQEAIFSIINNISFSKGNIPATKEGKIVQDADRLDALGAIGIGRCFAYGGKQGRLLYDPQQPKNTSIQHFYDKLLLLKEQMNTTTAKELAEARHRFMEVFLATFFAEWERKQ